MRLFIKEREEYAQRMFIEGNNYYCAKGRSQDYSKALEYYLKASELGHVDATYMVGLMYNNGYGAPQDYSEAIKYYLRASDMGHSEASYKMGKFHFNRKQYVEALSYYVKAGQQGNPDGFFDAGRMTANGLGTEMDIPNAVNYIIKAGELEARFADLNGWMAESDASDLRFP